MISMRFVSPPHLHFEIITIIGLYLEAATKAGKQSAKRTTLRHTYVVNLVLFESHFTAAVSCKQTYGGLQYAFCAAKKKVAIIVHMVTAHILQEHVFIPL